MHTGPSPPYVGLLETVQQNGKHTIVYDASVCSFPPLYTVSSMKISAKVGVEELVCPLSSLG